MLPRYLFPLSVCLSHVAHSSDLPNAVFERDESLIKHEAITRHLQALQKSKDDTGLDLEEQKQTLEEFRKNMIRCASDGGNPLSKKQRRLQYVNELLSHNSDLKKQSLIKVINNLNKCGVECTLSTQGKGSHITLSVDGKKHTISSKMQIGHLKRDLQQSGVDFSVSEHTSEMRSDQNLKEHEIRVDELTKLFKSLDMDIGELQKEQQQLREELDSQKEGVEEMLEAYLFCATSHIASDLILHRSYGRTNMIWQIFNAVMADLPHYGHQWDFQRAVKNNMLEFESDWGSGYCPLFLIQMGSTKALQTRAQYFDGLAVFFETNQELTANLPISPFFNGYAIDLYSLGKLGILDRVDLVDHTLLEQGLQSFTDENDRKPDLFEFREIMDASKMEESANKELFTFDGLIELIKSQSCCKEEMKPIHQHTLQITEKNPNDNPEYLKMISEDSHDFTFDELMQINELYDQCKCNIAQADFDMAMDIASKMWDHDKDRAVLFMEKLLKQTPFEQGYNTEKFGDMRRDFGQYLYNQAMQKIRKMHVTKQFSDEPMIDIQRGQKIWGLMCSGMRNYSRNQLYITQLFLELGDRERATKEASRVASGIPTAELKVWHGIFQERFNFNMAAPEVIRLWHQWNNQTDRESAELSVQLAEERMPALKRGWRNRENETLERMVDGQEVLQEILDVFKDQVRIQIHCPKLWREVHELKQQFDDYIKRAKKKTQKRGKRGEH